VDRLAARRRRPAGCGSRALHHEHHVHRHAVEPGS
jgi:hypothetical protein